MHMSNYMHIIICAVTVEYDIASTYVIFGSRKRSQSCSSLLTGYQPYLIAGQLAALLAASSHTGAAASPANAPHLALLVEPRLPAARAAPLPTLASQAEGSP